MVLSASNVVLVLKKDKSIRCCVDYRRLNDCIRKDAYPLPKIVDCFDALGGTRYYSSLDLRQGYYQVAMDEASKDKTSFVTRRGTYRFKVMPFGLCNAPATFSRLMDLVLSGLSLSICLVYLDDILVFSRTVEEHAERLELVFQRLRKANLKLKPSKCSLLQTEVSFLGHRISADGITTDPAKIESIVNWPVPTSISEVRSFVGLCSYYRRFVKDFSEIAAPLHDLTKKHAKFVWTADCQNAFEVLKEHLTTAPILTMPVDEGEYRLDTDASAGSLGAVLCQVQD